MAASASEPDMREDSPPRKTCDIRTKTLLDNLKSIIDKVRDYETKPELMKEYLDEMAEFFDEPNTQILIARAKDVFPDHNSSFHKLVRQILSSVDSHRNKPLVLTSMIISHLSALDYIIAKLDCTESLHELKEQRRQEIKESLRQGKEAASISSEENAEKLRRKLLDLIREEIQLKARRREMYEMPDMKDLIRKPASHPPDEEIAEKVRQREMDKQEARIARIMELENAEIRGYTNPTVDELTNALMRKHDWEPPDDSSGGRSRRHRRSKRTRKSKRSKQMSRFRKKRTSPLNRTVLSRLGYF